MSTTEAKGISSGKKMLLILAVSIIVAIYATSIFFSTNALYINKDRAQQNHKARMSQSESEPG
ncbi:MAG: hypothetical protein HQL78_03845, partial [Magnetococcales bacterium]|nr:hypothetical protein [Magnetococcales bacterium]